MPSDHRAVAREDPRGIKEALERRTVHGNLRHLSTRPPNSVDFSSNDFLSLATNAELRRRYLVSSRAGYSSIIPCHRAWLIVGRSINRLHWRQTRRVGWAVVARDFWTATLHPPRSSKTTWQLFTMLPRVCFATQATTQILASSHASRSLAISSFTTSSSMRAFTTE